MLERASFWKVHRFFIEQQPATKREIVQGMRKRQEELCDCAQLSSWLTRTLPIERESQAAWGFFQIRNARLRMQARPQGGRSHQEKC